MEKRLFGVARFALAGFVLSACSAGRSEAPLPLVNTAVLQSLDGSGAGKIKHVVYVIQENRSFNDMFMGYPNAYTVTSGEESNGKKVKLLPTSLKIAFEMDHSAFAMFTDCNGTGALPGTKCRMNGFNEEHSTEPGGRTVFLRSPCREQAVSGHGERIRFGRPVIRVAAR